MFTGIIEAVGKLSAIEANKGDARLKVHAGSLMDGVSLGDSIAVNGVCLTVVGRTTDTFSADVSAETLSRTTLGTLSPGANVNLERALLPTTRLGGHLVSGHIDGVGTVTHRCPDARSERFKIDVPLELVKYIAEKGSICVDGISLTVNSIQGTEFELNIVPHTLQETTMGGFNSDFNPGRKVNLEVDIIARYLERLLTGNKTTDTLSANGAGITVGLLAEHGFLKS